MIPTPAERPCGACHDNPTHDTFVICQRCQSMTRSHLADMASHERELRIVLAKQTRYEPSSDGGRTVDPRMAWQQALADSARPADTIDPSDHAVPYSRAAAARLHEQRNILVGWCRLLAEEMQVPLPADTMAAMAGRVRQWTPTLAKHEAAGELVTEVRNLVRAIFSTLDSPPMKSRIPVGPCPKEYTNDHGNPEWCPGQVAASFPADESLRPLMHCGACDAIWYSEQWHNAGVLIIARKQAIKEAIAA